MRSGRSCCTMDLQVNRESWKLIFPTQVQYHLSFHKIYRAEWEGEHGWRKKSFKTWKWTWIVMCKTVKQGIDSGREMSPFYGLWFVILWTSYNKNRLESRKAMTCNKNLNHSVGYSFLLCFILKLQCIRCSHIQWNMWQIANKWMRSTSQFTSKHVEELWWLQRVHSRAGVWFVPTGLL